MKKSIRFAVLGGDMRQVYLARLLHADGHMITVSALGLHPFPREIHIAETPAKALERAQAVILPIPIVRENDRLNAPLCSTSYALDDILQAVPFDIPVFGGAISPPIANMAHCHKLQLIDLLAREDLAIRNAVPTAEGAIELAMAKLPITLHGARVLVIGNGRIGRLLAEKLSALHARVWVSARSPRDFAQIESAGLTALDTRALSGHLSDLDLIVNTVPALVLDADALAETPMSCLIIDLASRPGGVDFAAADALGRQAIHALSLPGKVAPMTAAGAIRDTIYSILQEENLL